MRPPLNQGINNLIVKDLYVIFLTFRINIQDFK